MTTNPKRVEKRLNEVIAAWETLRPAKTFAGLTLEQLKAAWQPSFAARDRATEHRNQLVLARNDRLSADRIAFDLLDRIVAGVKADPDESGDGGLYQAMGYVPKSARRSGLTRLRKPTTALSVAAK